MTRIAIMPYGPSDSVTALASALQARGHTAIRMRRVGSNFRGREGELLVNWGNSQIDLTNLQGRAALLNPPSAIRNASHKTTAFNTMAAANIPLVENTTDRSVAQQWLRDGHQVYARTVLQGHSGEGIIVCATRRPQEAMGQVQYSETLVNAPLYTKGIADQRREFRIHVMNGVITFVQQKRRVDGWRDLPEYSGIVRNHSTGWIYAQQSVAPNDAATRAAIAAVTALSLNFGAVDVITRREEAWVLEVNTAPGLTGQTLETYADALVAVVESRVPRGWTPTANEADQAGDENFALEATPVTPEQAPAARPTRGAAARRAAPALTPVAGAFYKAVHDGIRTIAQYNEPRDAYYIPGWDVPITLSDGFTVDLSARIEV